MSTLQVGAHTNDKEHKYRDLLGPAFEAAVFGDGKTLRKRIDHRVWEKSQYDLQLNSPDDCDFKVQAPHEIRRVFLRNANWDVWAIIQAMQTLVTRFQSAEEPLKLELLDFSGTVHFSDRALSELQGLPQFPGRLKLLALVNTAVTMEGLCGLMGHLLKVRGKIDWRYLRVQVGKDFWPEGEVDRERNKNQWNIFTKHFDDAKAKASVGDEEHISYKYNKRRSWRPWELRIRIDRTKSGKWIARRELVLVVNPKS